MGGLRIRRKNEDGNRDNQLEMRMAPQSAAVGNPEPIPPPQSKRGEWTWELVTMFPRQGEWTEDEYLRREFDGHVEFVDGVLEFLPVPALPHQDLVTYFFERLNEFIGPRTPREVYFAPVCVRTAHGNVREPHVAYIRASRVKDRKAAADGADLVMEVISDDKRDRDSDYFEKRNDYATTRIPEYWIIDPTMKIVTGLVVDGTGYRTLGEFKPGEVATSELLPGFEIEVKSLFAAAQIE